MSDGLRVRIAATVLLVVGLTQMAADGVGCVPLKGLAAATQLSPAPKVFSSVRGYETFSTVFFIDGDDDDGVAHSLEVTPERYAAVRGPYQRRNVYGAALSYGPVLPETLLLPVMRFALCGEAPLLQELGLSPVELERDFRHRRRVRFVPRPGIDLAALALPSTLVADCEAP